MRSIQSRQFLVSLNVLQLFVFLFLLRWKQTNEKNEPRVAAALLKQEFLNPRPPSLQSSQTLTEVATNPKQLPHGHPIYPTSSYTFHYSEGNKKKWNPPLELIYAKSTHEMLMARLERLFFNKTTTTRQPPTTKHHQELLLFLRIPKTSSTSVIRFLQKHARNLATVDHFLNAEFYKDAKRYRGTPGCIFGTLPLPPPQQHRRAMGGGKKQKRHRRPHNHRYVCPHNFFGGNMRTLAQMLAFWNAAPSTQDRTVTIHPFTIVRDPFHRMVSLFHYLQKVQGWQKRFTPEQKRHLRNNELEPFLQSVHKHGSMDQIKGLLSQQNYLSSNAQIAQTLIRQGRVLILVMECFDVSLQLMGQVYSHILDPRDIFKFLKDEELHHLNERDEDDDDDDDDDDEEGEDDDDDDNDENDDDEADDDGEDEDDDDDEASNTGRRRRLEDNVDMAALRTKVEAWFPDHFTFHRVALERFQKDVQAALLLPGTILSQTQAKQCFDKLGLQSKQ